MRFKIKKTGSFKFSKKYLDLISNSKVYDVAINTPITFAANLYGKLGNKIFLSWINFFILWIDHPIFCAPSFYKSWNIFIDCFI